MTLDGVKQSLKHEDHLTINDIIDDIINDIIKRGWCMYMHAGDGGGSRQSYATVATAEQSQEVGVE